MIAPIVEGESGLSVRNKLNEMIDVANVGSTFVTAYAVVANNGTVSLANTYKILSVARLGTGIVQVTFATLLTVNYGVLVTVANTSQLTASVEQKTTTSCVVRTRNTAGTITDTDFSVLIFGG